MIGELNNHLWQSTLFVLAAGLLNVAFRKDRAEIRYWLWFSASFKFLLPFSLLLSFGSHIGHSQSAKSFASPAVSFAMEQITQPFPHALGFAPSVTRTSNFEWITRVILAVWAFGFGVITLIRFRCWRRIRAAVRSSVPVDIPAPVEVRLSPGLLEPGVVGFVRPILLLPTDIVDRLTPPQLRAVLAHESCHIRRGDNLTSAIHMIVEAVFWFHPLVWWIGARLVQERERACDEAVLNLGSGPHEYAEGILAICKSYLESPLACISGVTGSNLKKRVHAILMNHVPGKLNARKRVVLALAALTALAAPIVVGTITAPRTRAQSLIGITPRFADVSISPCTGVRARKSRSDSPEDFHATCQTLVNLIQEAYSFFADGHVNIGSSALITGGPNWTNSDRYEIDAKTETPQNQATKNGPMLQALLEDRFKLKIHRETRDVPVFALTVAEGGPKLRPFQQGSCIPPDFNHPPPPDQPLPSVCGMTRVTDNGFDAPGVTMAKFCRLVSTSVPLGRSVVDRTGVEGPFNIHLDLHAADLGYRVSGPQASPSSIFTSFNAALQKIGLKLEPANGSIEAIVIDSVQRPSEE